MTTMGYYDVNGYYVNPNKDKIVGYFDMNPNGEKQEFVAKATFIRDWYMKEFPTDECGQYIDKNATFYGLFETLDNHGDVYGYIGEGDSVIRERCFAKLAEIMNVDYDYIYEQWRR